MFSEPCHTRNAAMPTQHATGYAHIGGLGEQLVPCGKWGTGSDLLKVSNWSLIDVWIQHPCMDDWLQKKEQIFARREVTGSDQHVNANSWLALQAFERARKFGNLFPRFALDPMAHVEAPAVRLPNGGQENPLLNWVSVRPGRIRWTKEDVELWFNTQSIV